MTFATYEESVESGQPLELYEFTEGTNRYYYTNAADDFVLGDTVYKSVQISRANIELSSEVSKGSLAITFPRDNEFAIRFIGQLYDFVSTITVKRGHSSDPDSQFLVYWRGRVVSGKADGAYVELACESVFTSLRRHGVRARYQRNCRHVVYGLACGLSQSLYEDDGTVIGIVGLVLTIPAAASRADGWFTGGLLRIPGGPLRLITSHVGTQVTLARPLLDLEGGMAVKLAPGCDHLHTTCTGKFNNTNNFGGFPYIPLKNPFGGTSLV